MEIVFNIIGKYKEQLVEFIWSLCNDHDGSSSGSCSSNSNGID